MLLVLLACHGKDIPIEDDSSPVGHDSVPDSDSLPTVQDSDSPDTFGESPPDSGESGDTGVEPLPVTPDVIVDCNGGGDFTTITEAIAASVSGTKIGLMACTYTEDINFIGKTIDIFGIDGSATTTIDGSGTGPVVTAIRGESLGTRLAGVTVTGGGGNGYGAGLLMNGSVLLLEDVVFTGNNRTYAVLYGQGISVTLIDTVFRDNNVLNGGVVSYIDNGNFLAQRLTMECGNAYIGIYEHNATLLLDSEVDCPDASYAIYVDSAELSLRRTSVTGGEYGVYGADSNDTRNERMWVYNSTVVGGDVGVSAEYLHFKADNSVFYGGTDGLVIDHCHADSYVYNSALIGADCALQTDRYAYAIGWNAIGDGEFCRAEGFSTIVGDPRFVDAPNDFHLKAGSPLIDAGDPDPDHDDVDGSRNDVGAFGGPSGSW